MNQHNTVRDTVREHYAARAAEEVSPDNCAPECCSSTKTSSCGGGYTAEELTLVPGGADLGLGCGNPTLVAELNPGEVVLDLGSGAGIDCFLAARRVGPEGRVIGVDMTSEMLLRARKNADAAGLENVEFREGLIEALPLEDGTIDVIVSNCVVNLSPEKERVFAEAFRVLKPGGRLAVADLVARRPFSEAERADASRYSECITGAETAETITTLMKEAGFADIAIETSSKGANPDWNDGAPETAVYSAIIRGRRPA